jgi:hypothetical protein
MKKLFFAIILCFAFAVCDFAQTEKTPDIPISAPDNSQQQQVCLTQTEANAVYALAEKGKKFDAYAAKAESDISDLKASIVTLKIELAKATQQNIDLSNQAIRDNAALEQNRQYFYTSRNPKCKFSIVCVP